MNTAKRAKDDKIIVHIFQGETYHLSPNISAGYLTYTSEFNHVFILYGSKHMDKQRYQKVYKKYDFTNYVFCHNLIQLIFLLIPYRKKSIIFHAGSYLWMLIAIFIGCKNINWVCWGQGANSGVSFIGRHIAWLKRFIYNKFYTIVTLMDQDKLSIEKYYHVPLKNIKVISYMLASVDEYRDLYDKLRREHTFAESGKPVVLLGNNPFNMSNYIDMIHRLAKLKGRINVQCMLNYALVKDALYEKLIQTGNDVFGDDFKANEEFYEFRDYLLYMSKCDIYICGNKSQSGIGAINTCLRLGKKVYITGKNYDWIKGKYNSIVFQSDEIKEKMDCVTFLRDLSLAEKEFNNNSVTNNKPDDTARLWIEYLNKL